MRLYDSSKLLLLADIRHGHFLSNGSSIGSQKDWRKRSCFLKNGAHTPGLLLICRELDLFRREMPKTTGPGNHAKNEQIPTLTSVTGPAGETATSGGFLITARYGANSVNHDVIIVGGGPTGLWLACELALQGVHVVVLESLAKPTDRSEFVLRFEPYSARNCGLRVEGGVCS